MDKNQIRRKILALREKQPLSEKQEKDTAICDAILSVIPEIADGIKGKNISFFYSHKGEPDLIRVRDIFLEKGASCYYPITCDDEIKMALCNSQGFKEGRMGVMEPCCKISKNARMDIVFVPGIAFDNKGNRIGFGKGYYDKYLSGYNDQNRPVTLAPIYDFQLLPAVPSTGSDVPVDIIVSEKEIIYSGAKRNNGKKSRA